MTPADSIPAKTYDLSEVEVFTPSREAVRLGNRISVPTVVIQARYYG